MSIPRYFDGCGVEMQCMLEPCAFTKRKMHSIFNQNTTPILLKNGGLLFSVVAEISGFELNANNGNQSQLVNDVVQRVWRKVRETPLKLAKCLSGWHEKIKDVGMRAFLKHPSQKD